MEGSGVFIGITALFLVAFIVFIIRKNLKDKKETEKFFNEEIRQKKDIELSDDDEF